MAKIITLKLLLILLPLVRLKIAIIFKKYQSQTYLKTWDSDSLVFNLPTKLLLSGKVFNIYLSMRKLIL